MYKPLVLFLLMNAICLAICKLLRTRHRNLSKYLTFKKLIETIFGYQWKKLQTGGILTLFLSYKNSVFKIIEVGGIPLRSIPQIIFYYTELLLIQSRYIFYEYRLKLFTKLSLE